MVSATQEPDGRALAFAYGTVTRYGAAFQTASAGQNLGNSLPCGCLALLPRPDESDRFGLFRVRSPLLTESLLLSPPRGTEMFQFPRFAPCTYGFSTR